MFNLFRSREKSVRYLLGAILGVISLSMLLYLIPGGPGSGGITNQNVIATVGGNKITTDVVQQAVDRMVGNQTALPRAIMAQYVPAMTNQLVELYAKAYKAKQLGLTISDDELAGSIQQLVAQQLGGKFDPAIYRQMVEQRFNWTVPQYEEYVRTTLMAARYDALAAQSLVVTDAEAKREYQRENEKVALKYIKFDQKDFSKKVNTDPAVLKAWFEKNRALFRQPEKRSFELIVGSDADFGQSAQISDNDLRRRYQDNLDSYRTPERVQVRHILVKTTGVPKDQVPKLRAKADDLLKQLKSGGDFAALATKNSDDPGSASKGGDLGWIVKGQTVPDFEKAAFSLKPKELSGVITTEYGFHIIQVLDHQAAHTQGFEEVKPQIVAEAQKEIGAQNMQKAISAARDEVSRNPSQAEAIAKKNGLKFYKVNQAGTTAVLPEVNSQPEVLTAVFATPKGQVTQVQPMDNLGKAAFAEVTEIFPARNSEFNEAQKEVTSQYTNQESARLMREAAKQAVSEAKQGQTLENVAKHLGGEVKTAPPFTSMGAAEGIGPAKSLADAFKPETKVGDTFGPVLEASSAFVLKVTEKTPADMSQFAQNRQNMVQAIKTQKAQIQGSLFGDSVVADLKKRGVVKMNDEAMARLMAAYKS